MKAVQQLPPGYRQLGTICLTKNTPLLVMLSVFSLPLFAGALWLFGNAVYYLAPGFTLPEQFMLDGPEVLALLGVLLGIIIAVVLLHEAVHGLFFWLFSRHRPSFGISWTYAYAAAPGWYFPRGQYLVVGLAPLFILSLAGVLLLPVLPSIAIPGLVLALTLNATGAIGDLYIVGRLLFTPRRLLVLDQKDQITWYCPSRPRA